MHDFGGGIQAQMPAEPQAQQARLPHNATAPWRYVYHPLRWQWVDGEWLPQLGTLRLAPGSGGVDKGGDTSFAEVDLRRRGWSILPPETGPGGSYVRAWPAQGGLLHVSAWEQPRWYGDRPLESEVDTEGYRAWLRSLIEDGHIEPPSDPAIALQVDMQRKRANSAASRATARSDGSARAERQAATLQAMEATKGKPKTTRRRKSRTDA